MAHVGVFIFVVLASFALYAGYMWGRAASAESYQVRSLVMGGAAVGVLLSLGSVWSLTRFFGLGGSGAGGVGATILALAWYAVLAMIALGGLAAFAALAGAAVGGPHRAR